jgi:hypothetical protein
VTSLGKSMPVGHDGTPHWVSCPSSENFCKSETASSGTAAPEKTAQLDLF